KNTSIPKWLILMIISFLLMIVIALYFFRYQIKTAFISRKFKQRHDEQTFEQAYHHLLDVLKHQGHTKAAGDTLREYAKQIDTRLNTTHMSELTAYYEEMVYNQHHIQTVHEDM